MKQHGLKAMVHVQQPEENVWTIPTIAALDLTLLVNVAVLRPANVARSEETEGQ